MNFDIEEFTLKVAKKIYFWSISARYNPSLCEAEINWTCQNLVAVQKNSYVTKKSLIKSGSTYLKLISILLFYTTQEKIFFSVV
jgi:hypothetical protein